MSTSTQILVSPPFQLATYARLDVIYFLGFACRGPYHLGSSPGALGIATRGQKGTDVVLGFQVHPGEAKHQLAAKGTSLIVLPEHTAT